MERNTENKFLINAEMRRDRQTEKETETDRDKDKWKD